MVNLPEIGIENPKIGAYNTRKSGMANRKSGKIPLKTEIDLPIRFRIVLSLNDILFIELFLQYTLFIQVAYRGEWGEMAVGQNAQIDFVCYSIALAT